MPSIRITSFACLLSLAPALAGHAADLSTQSPFMAAASADPKAGEQRGDYELTGLSSIDNKPLVCLFDKIKKKSLWLSQGTKQNEVELLSCDLPKGEATLRINGAQTVLSLRKPNSGKVAVATPHFSDVGPAGGKLPPVVPLTSQEEKEREARMLVSDLLEIGQRQRKAYEEAAKKAAAEGKPVPGAPPAQPPGAAGLQNPPPSPPAEPAKTAK